jgi:hypothetical protein
MDELLGLLFIIKEVGSIPPFGSPSTIGQRDAKFSKEKIRRSNLIEAMNVTLGVQSLE